MMHHSIAFKLGRSFGNYSVRNVSTNLTLYGFPLSQPTRAVLMLLQANNIPYSFKSVNALKGETRSKEFLAVNRTGMVPCITDDQVGVLAEHGAILTYLCEQHELNAWYPKDPVVRGRIQFWLNWNHTNTRHGTMGIMIGNTFPDKLGSGIELATKKYTRAIKFMESELVPGKFLAGTDSPTIADLSIVTEVDQLHANAFNYYDFSPYPKVQQWLELVSRAVPSYKAVHDPVVVLAKKANAK